MRQAPDVWSALAVARHYVVAHLTTQGFSIYRDTSDDLTKPMVIGYRDRLAHLHVLVQKEGTPATSELPPGVVAWFDLKGRLTYIGLDKIKGPTVGG